MKLNYSVALKRISKCDSVPYALLMTTIDAPPHHVASLTCIVVVVVVAGAFLRESPYAVWRSGGDHHDIQMLMGQ